MPHPPVGATDAHVTLRDTDAALAAYRAEMNRAGLARCIVVQCAATEADQTATLAALAALGPAARGVAVLAEEPVGRELDLLGAQGICGLRCRLPGRGEAMSWDLAAR